MTSRRTVLSSLGTIGVITLAGCSALPIGGNDGSEDVSLPGDAVESVPWPDSPFPVTVPTGLAETHRERSRELLAEVPSDLSVPNSGITEELRTNRKQAADMIDDGTDDPWPIERLSRWRSRRSSAASVRGAYRAATGEDDAATVDERRQTVHEDLGSYVAAHEYRVATLTEAVLVYAPIEDLIADCRRHVRPEPAYPADPVADPFQAGDAVGTVERARSTLADARGLREAYLTERSDVSSQWAALIAASDRLRFAVGSTRSSVEDFLDVDESPFDADLQGTAGEWLFRQASRRVTSTADEHRRSRADGNYATAVIEAGQALAAIEALRTTIEGINDGAYQDAVSAESVSQAAARAQDAISAFGENEDQRLTTLIGRPALETVDYLSRDIEQGRGSAARIQGDLIWAELYARAVPAATAFVIDRLG